MILANDLGVYVCVFLPVFGLQAFVSFVIEGEFDFNIVGFYNHVLIWEYC